MPASQVPPVNGQSGVIRVGKDVIILFDLSGALYQLQRRLAYQGHLLQPSWKAQIKHPYSNYEGTDGPHVVEPVSALVGSLRRKNDLTCAYNETNRDCVPRGTWNLETRDFFTFGLGLMQIMRFYGIFGGSY